MSPLRYSCVLFDLDQTLFDFRQSERESFAAMCAAVKLHPSPALFADYEKINRRLWSEVEAGVHTPSEVNLLRFQELVSANGLDADPAEMGTRFKAGLGDHGDLYAEVPALLDSLAAQCALGLVTNGITGIQRAKIARLELERWFPAIAISDELGVAKPNPAIFEPVLSTLGVTDRSQVLMVGDSVSSDMAGGRNAGLATCWYNPMGAETDRGELIDHHIVDLPELISIVRAD